VVCCGFDLWVTAGDDFSAVAMQPQQQRQKNKCVFFCFDKLQCGFWAKSFGMVKVLLGRPEILGYAKAIGMDIVSREAATASCGQ
jgi:hypothetical protein